MRKGFIPAIGRLYRKHFVRKPFKGFIYSKFGVVFQKVINDVFVLFRLGAADGIYQNPGGFDQQG
jgi:hypothetical protein